MKPHAQLLILTSALFATLGLVGLAFWMGMHA